MLGCVHLRTNFSWLNHLRRWRRFWGVRTFNVGVRLTWCNPSFHTTTDVQNRGTKIAALPCTTMEIVRPTCARCPWSTHLINLTTEVMSDAAARGLIQTKDTSILGLTEDAIATSLYIGTLPCHIVQSNGN